MKLLILIIKKRFCYNDDHSKIRANQEHSIKVDVDLQEKIPS